VINTIDALQSELDTLIKQHYKDGKWYAEGITERSENVAKLYQAKVRNLKHSIRMIQEEEYVSKFLDAAEGEESIFLRLMPLVSRRKHQELWVRIQKALSDGSTFSFEEDKLLGYRCNCTDAQLIDDEIIDKEPVSQEEVECIRNLHNNDLQDIDSVEKICSHWGMVTAHQNKHTIGNWDCRACLTVGAEIASPSDINNAMQNTKALEWCPKFFPVLRHLPMQEYLSHVKPNSRICYAGLLHSEMSFTEEVEGTAAMPEVTGDIVELTDIKDVVKKNFVVIKKKCDTCDFESEEKKEYIVPEQVKDEVLQVLT
jgi:hypothetical protein